MSVKPLSEEPEDENTDAVTISLNNIPVLEVEVKLSEQCPYDIGSANDWATWLCGIIENRVQELVWKNTRH